MKIVIKQGPNAGQELELEGSAIVGRDPAAATLVIEDPEASRRHASLTPAAGGGVAIEDLGSTNGTFLNGQRVEGVQSAAPGDEIRIGNSVLEVQSEVEVTRMSPIPEPADADATAIGSPVPEPGAAETGGYAEPATPEPAAYEPPPAPEPPPYEPPPAPEPPVPSYEPSVPEPPAYEQPPAPEPPTPSYEPAAQEPPPYEPPVPSYEPSVPEPPAYEQPPAPAYDEPTETAPPAPGGQPAAAPSAGYGAEPPPPVYGGPPPPAGGPPPPPGAGQGFGAPEQGYADPGYQQPPQYGQPGGPMVPAAYGPAGGGMETRDSTRTWLLCALVPFYALVHFHRTNKEMEAWSGGRIPYSAGSSITALTIGVYILVPPFVAISSYMGRVRTAQQMAGLQPQANFWGFLGRNFLFGYGWKWLQDQFNEIAVRQPQG